MSEDASKAETQEVDTSKADPSKGADSVHEQTREKGEKIEQATTREQVKRNREDGLEAPPGN